MIKKKKGEWVTIYNLPSNNHPNPHLPLTEPKKKRKQKNGRK
jgi:hypothetical protein